MNLFNYFANHWGFNKGLTSHFPLIPSNRLIQPWSEGEEMVRDGTQTSTLFTLMNHVAEKASSVLESVALIYIKVDVINTLYSGGNSFLLFFIQSWNWRELFVLEFISAHEQIP